MSPELQEKHLVDDKLAQRAREIFLAVLGREPGEWGLFLDQACGGLESLREEVESLLEYDRKAGGVLNDLAVGLRPEESARDPWNGRRIGPYKVLRRLGRGGMSLVYLALRADRNFQKRVALKLLQPGLENGDLVRRFRAEGRILAALGHPNIAQLLDGGTTEDGSPYLVMEYVEGRPIDEYCDRQGLSLRERIELFRTVCSAVHFAHRNLVVHRDLKPGNILVTAEGRPKLLDFGIAKLLNPELSAPTLAPTATARMMTPGYASPEQVRGEPITPASDVYSLGVLLYKLLTGRRPYTPKSDSPAEMFRLICEQEPERPSSAVRLHRRLAGDLDNIVLMALSKEPRRRYASVEQLSEDLRRYLEGRPVVAHKASFLYRGGRFVRRNRWAVTAALALVALVVANFAIVRGVRIPDHHSSSKVRPIAVLVDPSADVQVRLPPREASFLARPRVADSEAYRLYLRGRFHWNRRTIADLETSRRHFRQAIALDSAYAPAYAGLADAYILLSSYHGLPPDKVFPRAREAAERALAIDSALPEAYASLGAVRLALDWDFEAAARAYRRALELGPGYATAHQWYGELLSVMGLHEEAVAEGRRAWQLDPLSPIINAALGQRLSAAGRWEEALEQFSDALDLDPRFVWIQREMAYAHAALGQDDKALAARLREMEVRGIGNERLVELRRAVAEAGMSGFWRWELERLERRAASGYVPALLFAEAWAGIGARDRALDYLERAVAERGDHILQLTTSPELATLALEPRARRLLAGVGLAHLTETDW